MKVELRWESRNTIPKSLHPQWAFHLFTFTPNITSLPKKLRAATHLNMPAFPLRQSWNVKVKSFSHVWLFSTLWTVAYQDPLFMGFKARVLEWIAVSFSRGSSVPKDRTQVSHIACRHFTVWATREDPETFLLLNKSSLCFFDLFVLSLNIFCEETKPTLQYQLCNEQITFSRTK